jgi:hypothetical protein
MLGHLEIRNKVCFDGKKIIPLRLLVMRVLLCVIGQVCMLKWTGKCSSMESTLCSEWREGVDGRNWNRGSTKRKTTRMSSRRSGS